jgi:hypothetical protein
MSRAAGVRGSSVTDLIIDELSKYPDNVRDICLEAIKAAEHSPERTVVELIMARIVEYTKVSGGDGA